MCSDGSGDALADLEPALDRVADEDLKGTFGPQVLDRSRRLLTAKNRLDAQLARTVREGELTQAPEYDGLKTMQSWLRGHGRMSASAAHRLVAPGGRWSTCRRWRRRSPQGGSPPSGAVIAPVARDEHRAARPRPGWTWPRSTWCSPTPPPPGRSRSWRRWCTTTWSGSTPTAPSPTPPSSGPSIAGTPTAAGPAASSSTRSAGRRCRPRWSRSCRPTGPPGTPARRAQQLGDAFVQWADNALAAGNLPFLRTVKPHVVVTIDIDDFVDPHTGPGAARTGFGARISAARARLAGLRRQRHPLVIGPDGQPLDLGRTSGSSRRTCAAPSTPGPGLRLRRLRRPHLVVRRPPPSALARRRSDHPSTTARCSANATTPRSTTASASSDNPTADGAPTAPTAPRS